VLFAHKLASLSEIHKHKGRLWEGSFGASLEAVSVRRNLLLPGYLASHPSASFTTSAAG